MCGNYVVVPMSDNLNDDHAVHLLKEANAKAIFLSPTTAPRWSKIVARVNRDIIKDYKKSEENNEVVPVQVFDCLGPDNGRFQSWLQESRTQWTEYRHHNFLGPEQEEQKRRGQHTLPHSILGAVFRGTMQHPRIEEGREMELILSIAPHVLSGNKNSPRLVQVLFSLQN